jgi:hypothetical protein
MCSLTGPLIAAQCSALLQKIEPELPGMQAEFTEKACQVCAARYVLQPSADARMRSAWAAAPAAAITRLSRRTSDRHRTHTPRRLSCPSVYWKQQRC